MIIIDELQQFLYYEVMPVYKINSDSRDTQAGWQQSAIAEIGVKIGQSDYEGNKFACMLDWAVSRFDTLTLTLSDTLYRHNYEAEGHSKDVAMNMAKTYGDFWLARNKPTIREFGQKADIIVQRWDEWTAHPEFDDLLKNLQTLYRQDERFYTAARADIEGFLNRYGDKITPSNKFLYYRKFYDHLLEQLAVYILIGREIGSAQLYPGPDLQSFGHLRQIGTPNNLKGLENSPYVRLSFHRNYSLLPISEDDDRDVASGFVL